MALEVALSVAMVGSRMPGFMSALLIKVVAFLAWLLTGVGVRTEPTGRASGMRTAHLLKQAERAERSTMFRNRSDAGEEVVDATVTEAAARRRSGSA